MRNQETRQLKKKKVRVGVVRAPHAQHASYAPAGEKGQRERKKD